MNAHITPEEFEAIRGFLAGYVPGATVRAPKKNEQRAGSYGYYGDTRCTAIIEVNGAFCATIEHEIPSRHWTGGGSDRWIAKGPYIPRAGGQKWGVPSMWRKQLQALLDAVKPHLRVASPYEMAREATANAEAQLKDWFADRLAYGTPERAVALRANDANHLRALLVFAADHPIPVVGPLTPAWIDEAEQDLSSIVAAIKDSTMAEAAQQGMREMWHHFDRTHEGAPA